jgi:hypothetical protein
VDRSVVDGRGRILASLGVYEEEVRDALNWGNKKSNLAVQAFALDLCGDERDELLLYQPYRGTGLFIFTQPDADRVEKPYRHTKQAYNIHTYF